MEKIELTFRLERETKGAVRFEECNLDGAPAGRDEQVVGKLYVRKSALKEGIPRRLHVTLEYAP